MNASHAVRYSIIVIAGLCAGTAVAQTGPAVNFPYRSARVVVPSAPSGGTDLIARLTAQKVGEYWGQSVIVDNVSGGATRIGTNTVAKSAPDGHTMLLTTVNFAFIPAIYPKLPYDPAHDFTPVIQLAATSSLLVVHPVLPVKSVAQLVALAKSKPGEIRYGSGGTGSVGHLVGAMFQALAGVQLLHVPYKGTGPVTTALMGGEIHMQIANMSSLLPHVKSGRLRALAVTGATRTKIMPELPTIAESGVPGYEYSGWYGLWVPVKTPATAVTKINEDFNRALTDSTVKQRFAEGGIEPLGGTQEKFAAYLTNEFRKWNKVARDAGIKMD